MSCSNQSPLRQRAMSLVELLVVMVIIGIIAVVAFPSYRGYMQRAQRTEAKDALVRLANNQERHYIQFNTYTNDLTALGFDAGSSDSGLYDISVTGADQQGFTAAATPSATGGMTADVECTLFTIDEAGLRTASPDPNGKCW
ncbi:MAG TPA: type IV pilin protein [Gammaproteobacteria bacterium]|nr:type IV pilin protein [Gammaproteobacteria bacterium]